MDSPPMSDDYDEFHQEQNVPYQHLPPPSYMKSEATIFAMDLDPSATQTDLELLFEAYGDLKFVELTENDFLRYASVHFEDAMDAFRAIESLNGSEFKGKALWLKWGFPCQIVPFVRPHGVPQGVALRVPMVQVLFSFICSQQFAGLSTEFFASLFSTFGLLVDVSIKRVKISQERSTQSGYGFVHFCQTWEGLSASVKAVRWFRKKPVDGITVDAKFGEQFKRFLQRNAIFAEDDPIFTESAPPSSHVQQMQLQEMMLQHQQAQQLQQQQQFQGGVYPPPEASFFASPRSSSSVPPTQGGNMYPYGSSPHTPSLPSASSYPMLAKPESQQPQQPYAGYPGGGYPSNFAGRQSANAQPPHHQPYTGSNTVGSEIYDAQSMSRRHGGYGGDNNQAFAMPQHRGSYPPRSMNNQPPLSSYSQQQQQQQQFPLTAAAIRSGGYAERIPSSRSYGGGSGGGMNAYETMMLANDERRSSVMSSGSEYGFTSSSTSGGGMGRSTSAGSMSVGSSQQPQYSGYSQGGMPSQQHPHQQSPRSKYDDQQQAHYSSE